MTKFMKMKRYGTQHQLIEFNCGKQNNRSFK